jgi:DNA-binding Xre family transcriptional regulator
MKTKKLLKMMIDKNMSKAKLAKLTEVTPQQIRNITSGTSNGSNKWWRKAAEVLECDLADIIE